VRAQKQAAIDSAQSVADAQRGLTRAQQDYRDALVETSELGSASMQKLRAAMEALGPEGQAFARLIFGLKDDFQHLRAVIQKGLFPGLQKAIETLMPYFPDFVEFAGTIAKVFGDIAANAAKMLTGDTWKQFFAVFRDTSPELIRNYATIFGNLATVMAQLATVAAPFAVKFSAGLASLTQAAVAFMASPEGQKLWLDFFASIERIGPDVLDFFKALFPAVIALAKALLPLGDLILKALTGILEWIAGMDPKTLQGIVMGILALVVAFQAAAAVIALVAAIMVPFGSIVGGIVFAVVALIGVLVYLYVTNEKVRDIIDATMRVIGAVVAWVFNNIVVPSFQTAVIAFTFLAHAIEWLWVNILHPVFNYFAAVASWLWNKILHPVFTAIGKIVSDTFHDIKWAWDNVLGPIIGVIAKIVLELWELGFKVAFTAIGKAWSALSTSLDWVWRTFIKPVFKAVGDALGVDDKGKEKGGGLIGAFKAAMGFIDKAWGALAAIAKKPVKFVIETVMNNGLIKGFNFLAGKLGMDKIDPIPIPEGFRDGGVHGVRPGYTPGRDTHLIAVGGGEAILRPEVTRALGADWVYAVNARAKRGGVRGAQQFLGGFADGGVAWPVNGARLGTPFGKKGPLWSSGYHTGQDFPAPTGTPIHAVLGGKVTSAAWSSWGGNLMKILVAGLGQMYYAHQSGFAVREGDQVSTGQQIGFVGATGNTTGPHLHLELRVGGVPIDPMGLFRDGGRGIVKTEDKPQEKSRLEKILGGLGDAADWVKNAVGNPLNWLKGKIEGPINSMYEQFGKNWLTGAMAKVPDKFLGALVDKIKGLVGADKGDDEKSNMPTSDVQRMVQQMAASMFGWGGGQWNALDWLVSHESSWNPNAQNPTSSAYGLFQFLDGTWGPYGPKTSDPRKQAEYGLRYIKDRYGSPEKAKAFWEGHHWYSDGGVVPEGPAAGGVPDNGAMMYDNGGMIQPGWTQVLNLTGKPEPVFTSDQFERMRGGAGGGFNYSPTFVATDLTAEDVAGDILFTANRMRRGGVYPGGKPT
jgi:hypothetical protein